MPFSTHNLCRLICCLFSWSRLRNAQGLRFFSPIPPSTLQTVTCMWAPSRRRWVWMLEVMINLCFRPNSFVCARALLFCPWVHLIVWRKAPMNSKCLASQCSVYFADIIVVLFCTFCRPELTPHSCSLPGNHSYNMRKETTGRVRP